MAVANYNLKGCQLNFAGINLAQNLKSVEFAPEADSFTTESDNGDVVISATNDFRVNCTLTFGGASAEHAKLSAVSEAGVNAGAPVVAPFLFVDGNGTTRVATDQALIKKRPSKKFSATPEDVAWELTLVCDAAVSFLIGGN